MADDNVGGTPAGAALDMAVGTAVAAELVNDGVNKPVDLAALPPNCLNCGAVVRGRFCVECGQTTDTHVPTLAEVAGDAITSLFNLDSRLWRTVTMLFFKPGLLTREFLAGRRARYVPPLRLYLVLSVLTFLVMSLSPNGNNDEDEIDLDGEAPTQEQEDAIVYASDAAAINDAVNAQVGAAQVNFVGVPAEVREDIAAQTADDAEESGTDDPNPDLDLSGVENLGVDDDGDLTIEDLDGNRVKLREGIDCEGIDLPVLARGSTVDNTIREACEEGKADNFRSILDAFVDNMPLLEFMVIPVMAIVLKVFYLFAKRNYLAHLVFLCHTHAFTFLLYVVLAVIGTTRQIVPALSAPISLLNGALLLLYLPAYYFLAMRRVYEQGVMLTLLKQFLLMIVYLVAVMLVFSVGFITVMLVT